MCPSYLDGDQAANGGPVIPVNPCPKTGTPLSEDSDGAHAVSMDADVGIAVQFSRSVEKAPAGLAAGLSKLNSMLGSFAASSRRPPQAVGEDGRSAAIQPGSVDMLGPIRLVIACLEGWRPHGPVLRRILDRGTARCSLERR